jgi:hypothetical protein
MRVHIHLHDASSVIQPTKPAASKPAPGATTPKPSIAKPATPKPSHPATKPPPHTPIVVKSTGVVKKASEAISKASEAVERNRQNVTDDMSRTKNGIRVWGESPEKALAKDAGTSEGAKKAAQTRKSHGGHAMPTPANTAAAHSQAHVYHKMQAGFGAGKGEHGRAAALHQYAQHALSNPNPMWRGKALEASKRAWEASKATKDAGTSEGAKKAAQTRKSHSGGATQRPIFNAAHHYEQSEKHANMAKSVSKGGTKEHAVAAELHNKASRLHRQATETGNPEHVAAARTAANRANAASRKLGHVFH